MNKKNYLDQFLLVDRKVVEDLIKIAHVGKKDVVLEIGAGSGTITRKLAKKAGKVIAIEIDKKFYERLKNLPKNVEIIFGDSLKIFDKKLKFNKIVANLPSSLIEPLMGRLTKIPFETAVFLIPLKFFSKLKTNASYNIYFETELIQKVRPSSFSPSPKTNWALIKMIRKPDPLKTKEFDRFVARYVYEHPKAKLKNARTEALIRFYRSIGVNFTKNQARKLINLSQNPPLL